MEITKLISIDPEETARIEMHSILNLLNALSAEIYLFCDLVAYREGARALEKVIADMADGLKDRAKTVAALEGVGTFSDDVLYHIRTLSDEFASATLDRRLLNVQEENIEALLEMLAVRATELLARRNPEESWREFTVDYLERSILQVLDVMQQISVNSPPVVYTPEEHTEQNQLFSFFSCNADLDRVTMPAVFQDVIRDLVANARKYTPAGGHFSVEVCETSRWVIIVVGDNGRGIPKDEISRAVEYGYRATNIKDRRTLGGGFGLTKAYLTTRRFEGRFFIDSKTGEGTLVRIELPVAASRRKTTTPSM